MVNLRDFPFIVHCFGWFHFTAPKQPVSSHLSWFPYGLFVGGLQHQLHCSTQRWCSGFNLCNWSNQWSPSSCGATGLLRMRRRLVFLRVDGSKGFLKDHPKNACFFLNPQKIIGFFLPENFGSSGLGWHFHFDQDHRERPARAPNSSLQIMMILL